MAMAVGAKPSIEGLSLNGSENIKSTSKAKWTRPMCKKSMTIPVSGYHAPSTPASIPSRFQTFFYSTTENRGFNSQAARFSDHLNVQDNPGPGSYSTTQHSSVDKNIFSQKGLGGLASKNDRFARRRKEKVGPGSYDPCLTSSHHDFNKTNSRNFHPLIANKKEEPEKAPAPNSYTVSTGATERNQLVTAEAAFKSKTPRASMKLYTAYTPSPNCYKVSEELLHPSSNPHKSAFISKSNRQIMKSTKGPGPADYSPFSHKRVFKLPYYRQKHFLCFSAPALPLPPLPPPPGPGHYEIMDQMAIGKNKKKCPASGSVFKSLTGRWVDPDGGSDPGPADYNPRPAADIKRSYLYNVHGKWV